MVSLSKKRCLLDTNVLVALINRDHRNHARAVKLFDRIFQKEFSVVISSQNLLELSAVLVHGYKQDRETVKKDISRFASDSLMEVVYPDFQTLEKFFSLMNEEEGLHLTDLYLLSTAISFQIKVLITGDTDFEKIKSRQIQVYDPFL